MRHLCRPFAREEGQTMAEYGVVLTVITVASLAAFSYLSVSIFKGLNRIASFIS